MSERQFKMERELVSRDYATIERIADDARWPIQAAHAYYDKLRRSGESVGAARRYTLTRAKNLAEQRQRRLSHETGAS